MECQAHNRKCTFDELADKRRKANARQAQENLESERAYLKCAAPSRPSGPDLLNSYKAVIHLILITMAMVMGIIMTRAAAWATFLIPCRPHV
jgi:hypothetical protein